MKRIMEVIGDAIGLAAIFGMLYAGLLLAHAVGG